MNETTAALKKKIELKEKQLKAKEEQAAKNKEAVKRLGQELEQLQSELARAQLAEIAPLMREKNLDLEDVKAAIASGAVLSVKKTEAPIIKNESEVKPQ